MALPWVEGAGLDRGASPTPSLCAVPRAQANELFVMFRTGNGMSRDAIMWKALGRATNAAL